MIAENKLFYGGELTAIEIASLQEDARILQMFKVEDQNEDYQVVISNGKRTSKILIKLKN